MDGIHDFLRYIYHQFPLPLCLGEKACDVKIDYMILVQMRQIPLRPRYLLVFKKPAGITGTVVVCTQHLCRVGLSKAPWPADTGQHFHCPYGLVKQCNQASLIYILRLQNSLEPFISWIQIYSH